jgi:hypothetical protein
MHRCVIYALGTIVLVQLFSPVLVLNQNLQSTKLTRSWSTRLQSTTFKGQKCELCSKTFLAFLSIIYKQNVGQIYNLHLGLVPPPKKIFTFLPGKEHILVVYNLLFQLGPEVRKIEPRIHRLWLASDR